MRHAAVTEQLLRNVPHVPRSALQGMRLPTYGGPQVTLGLLAFPLVLLTVALSLLECSCQRAGGCYAKAPAASAECSSFLQHISTRACFATFVSGVLIPGLGSENHME